MKSPSAPRPKRRWLRRLVVTVAGVVVVWASAFVWRWRAAECDRDALVAEIRARGEPLEWKDFAPQGQAEPNGAIPLLRAFALVDRATADYMRKSSRPELARIAATHGDNADQVMAAASEMRYLKKPRPGVYPEFEAVLRIARPALDLAAKACELPPVDLIPDYESTKEGRDFAYGHAYSTLCELEQIDVLDALGRGDGRRAYRAVLAALRLSDYFNAEPHVLFQISRTSSLADPVKSLCEALAYAEPTATEFAEIDKQLALMAGRSFRRPILGERAIWCAAVRDAQATLQPIFGRTKKLVRYDRYTAGEEEKSWLDYIADRAIYRYLGTPFARPQLLEIEAKILHRHKRALQTIDEQVYIPPYVVYGPPFSSTNWDSIFDNSYVLSILRVASTRYRLTTVLGRYALRIARFKFQHRRLPAVLTEIAEPGFAVEPLPLFDNRLPKYEPKPDGFMIGLDADPYPSSPDANANESYRLRVKYTSQRP
jgi:hypothetical protein